MPINTYSAKVKPPKAVSQHTCEKLHILPIHKLQNKAIKAHHNTLHARSSKHAQNLSTKGNTISQFTTPPLNTITNTYNQLAVVDCLGSNPVLINMNRNPHLIKCLTTYTIHRQYSNTVHNPTPTSSTLPT
eukprot:gene3385-2339_t